MFVSLSAALLQACGFGEVKEKRTALWRCRGMEMDVEDRQDKEEEEQTISLKSHKES